MGERILGLKHFRVKVFRLKDAKRKDSGFGYVGIKGKTQGLGMSGSRDRRSSIGKIVVQATILQFQALAWALTSSALRFFSAIFSGLKHDKTGKHRLFYGTAF